MLAEAARRRARAGAAKESACLLDCSVVVVDSLQKTAFFLVARQHATQRGSVSKVILSEGSFRSLGSCCSAQTVLVSVKPEIRSSSDFPTRRAGLVFVSGEGCVDSICCYGSTSIFLTLRDYAPLLLPRNVRSKLVGAALRSVVVLAAHGFCARGNDCKDVRPILQLVGRGLKEDAMHNAHLERQFLTFSTPADLEGWF